ncbi:conserved hypothetical protein [Theileria equi strain WA]|uniref:Uncharacterized protein n=1 Tax=Theileria equi strain WA TaxID=1537102 RepID=L1LF97_THEEQ|nr:conserved hypothetical protein [Theileria equi strain WA]EKX73920.1 conserved hypothetical protein [Theileria equi strain WA]|eukprot:XP_004833372.1 conserved hypothetical protein [Theileria equi strain WA]
MAPLVDDFESLSKKRKKLFGSINNELDSLIQLLQDLDKKLDAEESNDAVNVDEDVKSVGIDHGSTSSSALDVKNGSPSDCGIILKELASTVKSLDIHKKINKRIKEFNSEFSTAKRNVFGQPASDRLETLAPIKLDEKLVCRMIGMHLLHYGLFDVYEQLKLESIKLWGDDNKAIVGSVTVEAYKILHRFLDNIKNCNIDPAIEWIESQYDKSTLHTERFNELLINLYKIQFCNTKECGMQKVINKVKSTGITKIWKVHNEEIGKLMTQIVLGEPTPADFELVKTKTTKLFTRVFCEAGVLVKRPPGYIHIREENELLEPGIHTLEPESELVQEPTRDVSSKFIYRRWINEEKDQNIYASKQPSSSWLDALSAISRKPAQVYTRMQPIRRGLPKNWLSVCTSNEKKDPKMAYRYLNSGALSDGCFIRYVRTRLDGREEPPPRVSLSKGTIKSILSDPETTCRQILNISSLPDCTYDTVTPPNPYVDISEERSDRGTTVLIASADDSDDNFLGRVDSDESQRGLPTFSLTVFAGSSLFRDSRLSQITENELMPARLLNVSSGSRIHIRFPGREERRREHVIRPFESEESTTQTSERSSATLRDILRMIMRGLRSESSQPTTVVHLRNEPVSQPSIDDIKEPAPPEVKRTRVQVDEQESSEFIKVHLPYESPLSVITCAGHVTLPYLVDVFRLLFNERREVYSKVGMWLKSNQQLPVESDLGPAFYFHSFLTCAVSKDQTSSENPPIMLPCGHVICKVCFDRLSGKRRKKHFKCPMCPTMVEPNQVCLQL